MNIEIVYCMICLRPFRCQDLMTKRPIQWCSECDKSNYGQNAKDCPIVKQARYKSLEVCPDCQDFEASGRR